MLSGIGLRQHLEEMGIPVRVDLPGVGSGLRNDGFAELMGPPLKPSIVKETMQDGKWVFKKAFEKWATQGVQMWGPDDGNFTLTITNRGLSDAVRTG